MVSPDVLKKVPIFQSLLKAEMAALAGIATSRKVKKGEMLFQTGDQRKSFFVVLSGEMHIYRIFNEETQMLAVLEKDEYAVESALVNPNLRHEHNGEMLTDGEVLEIDGKTFTAFIKDHPVIGNQLFTQIIANLTERLHHANNKLVTIYSTGKIASTYDSLDNLTDLILSTILQIIRAKRGLFAIFKPLEGRAVIYEAKGYKNDQAIKNLNIPLNSDPILGSLYQNPRDITISEMQFQTETALHTPYASRNMLGTTLHVRKKVYGAILLGDKEGAASFSHNNQILLNIIGRQIVLSILTAELGEERGTEKPRS